MLVDTAGHYYNYQESAGFSLSPPPSPFPDNYFTFPTSAPEQAQWYHGYSAQSPLLSASASDIPETVRYSGHSGLSHGLGQSQELGNYGVQEAFGHDLGYSQSASLYSSNTNTNYQVQQWAESPVELFSPASNDSVYGTNSGTSSDSNSVGEEEEVDVAEEGAASGSQCQWGDCTEEFPDQTQLVTHINSHHVQNRRGSEEYPCYWRNCARNSKPFNAKYKLVTHLRVHTGERPFKCRQPDCGRSFARLENLKIHKRSHTGEKPFPCKYRHECQKSFSNSSDRAKHEQTHKDPKPYKCEVIGCLKRYTDPSSLRKHIKNHSKEEQEQVRLVKENMKVKRGLQSVEVEPGTDSTWGMVEHEMMNPCPAGNLNLMCGGGLVTSDWTRRVEEERFSHYYNTPLYLEV